MEIEDKEIKIPTRESIMLRLEALPGSIMDNEIIQLDLDDKIVSLETQLKVIKNGIKMIVATEKDNEDKLKYRNETAREVATEERLKNSKEYSEPKEKISKKKKELKERKIEYLL